MTLGQFLILFFAFVGMANAVHYLRKGWRRWRGRRVLRGYTRQGQATRPAGAQDPRLWAQKADLDRAIAATAKARVQGWHQPDPPCEVEG